MQSLLFASTRQPIHPTDARISTDVIFRKLAFRLDETLIFEVPRVSFLGPNRLRKTESPRHFFDIFSKWCPRRSQDAPKTLPRRPKTLSRAPKTPPRRAKMPPKTSQKVPRGPQDTPRHPQDGPKTSQETLKMCQDAQDAIKCAHCFSLLSLASLCFPLLALVCLPRRRAERAPLDLLSLYFLTCYHFP